MFTPVPCAPVGPKGPVGPVEPCGPVGPGVVLTAPVGPSAPVGPVAPCGPVEPLGIVKLKIPAAGEPLLEIITLVPGLPVATVPRETVADGPVGPVTPEE